MHDHTATTPEMPRLRGPRRAVAIATAVAVAAGLALGAAVGAPVRASAATTESEAADYASDVYGDAWDFSNAADFNTDFSGTRATVSGGALKVDLALGNQLFLVHSISGSLATGRDGARQPIDPAKYSRLTFSMDQPLTKHIGAVYWFTCREQTSACGGGFSFPVVQGPHVYDFDLTAKSNLLAKVPWRSAKKVVFRLDPVVLPKGTGNTGKQVSLDWVRLHAAPDATHPHAGMPAGAYRGYTVDTAAAGGRGLAEPVAGAGLRDGDDRTPLELHVGPGDLERPVLQRDGAEPGQPRHHGPERRTAAERPPGPPTGLAPGGQHLPLPRSTTCGTTGRSTCPARPAAASWRGRSGTCPGRAPRRSGTTC